MIKQLASSSHQHEGHLHPEGEAETTSNLLFMHWLDEIPNALQSSYVLAIMFAVMMLGMASGLVGSFMLLRKRSLMGDALSHATFPGVAVAFMLFGRWLPGLMAGAAVFGLLGAMTVSMIRKKTSLKDDTAMGIVLSVFFGLGIALMMIIQDSAIKIEGKAGLTNFIYGKVALLTMEDRTWILVVSMLVVMVCVALYKELKLLCFDDAYAKSMGWPTFLLDLIVLIMVTAITVVGLQAVGIILIIAMLIIPPAAARFWTEKLWIMMILSAVIGAIGAALGALLSSTVSDMPAGAVIVLSMAAIFMISMLLGIKRGVIVQLLRRTRTYLSTARMHFLRAFYELNEQSLINADRPPQEMMQLLKASRDQLACERSWSTFTLTFALTASQIEGLVEKDAHGDFVLTEKGASEAIRHVRNHRLWEMYLIEYADIAPSHVDRDADAVEHVLGESLVKQLEENLKQSGKELIVADIPTSPHIR